MSPSKYLFLLLTISMVFISHATTPTSSPKLYENVCKNLGNKEFEQPCLKLIEAYPRVTLAKSYLRFCKVFAKWVAIGKATKAQNYIKEMMKKYPSSTAIKECATSNYDYVVSELQCVLIEDPELISMCVRYAADGLDMCERNLVNEKIVNISSIHTINNNIMLLTDILMSAANHL
jgi:hypothetical protein